MMKQGTAVVVLLSALFLSTASMAEEVWTITSLAWEPYSGEDLPNQGSAISKLRQSLAEKDIRLEVEFYPWKRAKDLASQEGYVGYFPAWPEEVADGFIASAPVDSSEIAVMTHSDAGVAFDSLDELFARHSVGIIDSYVYPEVVQTAMKAHPDNVEAANSEKLLARKLSGQRNPVAITDPNVMMHYAEQEGLENISMLESLMQKELVVALRDDPDNQENIELLRSLLK